MERRLAAILAADMVSYSRLMGEDEAGTLAAYRRHCRELFAPKAAQYNGRIIKLTGDGALMEFASAVDAVAFAVEVQLILYDENAGTPEDRQFRYRIGINVGDIIIAQEDIYGDGVNLTARIEGLADPGGISLSRAAYEQVKSKLDLTFKLQGKKQVKNIAEPVTVYRILLDEKAAGLATPIVEAAATASPRLGQRGLFAVATALLTLILGGGLLWWQPWVADTPEVPEHFAYPLPEKPSIAVLPFINVSGEVEQEHFAHGLTDDLITELSKLSGVFVIARHSVFAVVSGNGKIQDVAAELGVRYVLEGSLQRADARIRINVKLIDALSGLSLWAERYDREYEDLFALQDDVIDKIIAALSIRLTAGERDLLAKIPTDNLEAYDYYLRAEQEGFYYSDVETYRRALTFYQRAIDLDPDFANAHAGIARVAVDVMRRHDTLLWSPQVARKISYDAAGQALRLDPDNARAHIVLSLLQLVDGRHREARASARKAVDSLPNNPEAIGNLALVTVHTGEPEAALAELERALRLDPAPPASFQLLSGVVLYTARDYDRAVARLEAARKDLPVAEAAREFLAAAYGQLGDRKQAEEQSLSLLRLFPESNLAHYRYLYDYWRDAQREHHLESLRKAGIPDWPFGFEGSGKDRLNGKQLAELTSNQTWIGQHKNGAGFMQYFDAAGNLAYRSANTSITGTHRVSGDQLCQRFEGYFLDRMTCGYVFRNVASDTAETEAQEKADYIHVSPHALKFFSLENR